MQSINSKLATHQARLATGKRILAAADDPAGMVIATTFDIRRQGMKTALNTIGDAKNLMSIMEGGLTKVKDILVKMRNKALEATGDTIGSQEKAAITDQLNAFAEEINDIVQQTKWNDNLLLGDDATASEDRDFLVDADGNTRTFGFDDGTDIVANQGFYSDVSATGSAATGMDLALNTTSLDVSSSSTLALSVVDKALDIVKEGIGQVGAFTARLTFKEEALTVAHENTEAAFNRIMNADMASEQVEASKLLILQQTSTAMLAQANVAPQFILSLFQ
jgi:flagellin